MADQTPEANEQQDFIEVPEEQASTNFFWTLGHTEVFNLQTTLRGNLTDVQISAHISMVKWALSHVVNAGGHAKQVGRADAAPVQATHAPTGDGKAVTAAAPASAAPAAPGVPNPTPQQGVNTLICTQLQVKPRTDGRIDLHFVGAGHRLPDITKVCKPEEAAGLLSPTGAWTVEHFAGAATYPVKMAVEWVASEKLNSKGNPYKNIVAIKVA